MACFDSIVIVDWSASTVPKRGKDSIWIALVEAGRLQWVRNLATRALAMDMLRATALDCLQRGQRLLIGLDFAFGYPTGMADRLASVVGASQAGGWQRVWSFLGSAVTDGPDNANNSYDVAARLNREVFADVADGPFWGHPHQHGGQYPGLTPLKPRDLGAVQPWRHAEHAAKGAKSLWQLAYSGAVGRQAITGIACLERWRHDPALEGAIAIWPFQTRFADDLGAPVTVAEIYPSLHAVEARDGEVLDAAQVRCVAEAFAQLSNADALTPLLARPADMDDATARQVVAEEGWIVGAGMLLAKSQAKSQVESQADGKPAGRLDYIRDPAEIYRQSFATVEREVDLTGYSPAMRRVVTRLVHSCGMTDVVDDLAFSDGAAEAGLDALTRGCAVWCDVEMVRSGIIAANLPDGCTLGCTLNDPRAAQAGKRDQTTRSAAAVDFWDDLEGSVCVIGNAPTALFRLLERIDEGAGKPALIIGIPVGFIGAAESKTELAADPRGVPFITVHGRRGGSAMASSVVNALAFHATGKS